MASWKTSYLPRLCRKANAKQAIELPRNRQPSAPEALQSWFGPHSQSNDELYLQKGNTAAQILRVLADQVDVNSLTSAFC